MQAFSFSPLKMDNKLKTMKKLIFTLIAMLLPMLASAVEIDGIYYKLDSGAKTAKVTSNPNYYQGDVSGMETSP